MNIFQTICGIFLYGVFFIFAIFFTLFIFPIITIPKIILPELKLFFINICEKIKQKEIIGEINHDYSIDMLIRRSIIKVHQVIFYILYLLIILLLVLIYILLLFLVFFLIKN